RPRGQPRERHGAIAVRGQGRVDRGPLESDHLQAWPHGGHACFVFREITMRSALFALAAVVAFSSGHPTPIQDSKAASLPAAAAPAHGAARQAIVKSLYDVISGPAGEQRNWQRFRSLFIAKAQLV